MLFEDSDLSKSELVERLGQILFGEWKEEYELIVEGLADAFDVPESKIKDLDCVKELTTMKIKGERIAKSCDRFNTQQLRDFMYDFQNVWFKATRRLLDLSRDVTFDKIEDLDRDTLTRQIKSKVRRLDYILGSPVPRPKPVKSKKSKKQKGGGSRGC